MTDPVDEVPMTKAKLSKGPNADLVDAVRSHRDQILEYYDRVADKNPVIVLDLERRKLHSYPYAECRAMLREASRAGLDEEYKKAVAKKKVLILVWDKPTRRLVTTKFRRA
jgi:hypothetical protein